MLKHLASFVVAIALSMTGCGAPAGQEGGDCLAGSTCTQDNPENEREAELFCASTQDGDGLYPDFSGESGVKCRRCTCFYPSSDEGFPGLCTNDDLATCTDGGGI